jgi:hypothetical protein
MMSRREKWEWWVKEERRRNEGERSGRVGSGAEVLSLKPATPPGHLVQLSYVPQERGRQQQENDQSQRAAAILQVKNRQISI